MSRLRRTTSSVLLAPLCLGLLTTYAVAPASARPEPVSATRLVAADPTPAPPAESTNAAEQALDVATAVLTQVPGKALQAPGLEGLDIEPTAALLELRNQLDDLDRADRREAKRLFARPDSSGDTRSDAATSGLWDVPSAARSTCDPSLLGGGSSDPFCVHYIPASTPSRHATNDAQVSQVVTTLREVWNAEIGSMGYRAPIVDAGRGGDDRLDVYLADTGDNGYYGYAVPEDELTASSAYLTLENDFTEFAGADAGRRLGLLQVTAAHEFFHVVQFAYDSYETSPLMESTATWMEEQVYDNIDDNRQFLASGSLRQPWIPLDADGDANYGNWAFHQLYSEALGADTVRRVWDHAAAPGPNYLPSLNAALAERGWNLPHAYRMFAQGQLTPSMTWAEGAAFPQAHVSRSWRLSPGVRSTGWRGPRLNHLAGLVYNINPAPRLTGRWKLRVQVDAPNVGGSALVAVHFTNGAVQHLHLRLRADGTARVNVPFSSRTVRKVALHVGNTTGSDGRLTRFRATAWR